jgi:hypothetical protein
MNLDGLFGDEEPFRDLAIPVSAGDMSQDFDLASAQRFITEMLGKTGSYLRGNTFFSRVDLADCFDQVLGGHALERVTASASFERTLNLDVTLERCQHDDAGISKFRAKRDQYINAAHVGESEIHERDVRSQFPEILNGLAAIGGLGCQQHIGLVPDDRRDPFPEERMVVNAKNSNTG